MARKRKRRGISIGTYVLTVLFMLTIFVGVVLFSRISGDIGEISLNPKMLTEPFEMAQQTITDALLGAGDGSASQQADATEAPVVQIESPVRSLTIGAVGQITIGDDLRRSARGGDGYDFSAIFQPVSYALSGTDLTIATLRTLVTDDTSDYGTYHAPEQIVDGLNDNGIGLFNLATDRIMDDGKEGVEKVRSIMQSAQVATAGAYLSSAERDTLPVKEINGIKIGILSYTDSISSTGKKAATDETIRSSVRMLDVESAKMDIAALRQKGAEAIIVLAHWGERSSTKASDGIRQIASALVEAGADIVLGTNPTQVHEIERRTLYNADGSEREAFIAYSLGNFLVDDTRESANITGMILQLTLSYDAQARRLSIQDAWYMPTWIMRWNDQGGQNRYRVIPAGLMAAPPEMTNSVYGNMNKAYQNLVLRLDSGVARPKPE